MKVLWLMLLNASYLAGTTLTGTLASPNSIGGATGTLTLSLSQPATISQTCLVGGGGATNNPISISVSSGAYTSPIIWGNDCLIPSGTSYLVSFRDTATGNMYYSVWMLAGSTFNVANQVLGYPGTVGTQPTGDQLIAQPPGTNLIVTNMKCIGTCTGFTGGSSALADPGSNGVVYRTALGVTAPATSAEVAGLFGSSGSPLLNYTGDVRRVGVEAWCIRERGAGNSTGSAWGTSYTVGTSANNLVQLDSSGRLQIAACPGSVPAGAVCVNGVYTTPVLVASLPAAAAGNNGLVEVVKDALTASDCTTGGGTVPTYGLCISNGTTWVSIGGGGSGTSITYQSNGTVLGSMSTLNILPGTGVTAVPGFGSSTGTLQLNLDTSYATTNAGLQGATNNPVLCPSASGSSTTYTASCAGTALAAYTAKVPLNWYCDVTPTGASTIAINGLSPVALVTGSGSGSPLTSSSFTCPNMFPIWYDGTSMHVVVGGGTSISLTTTGMSGAATLVGGTLNVPNYSEAIRGSIQPVRRPSLIARGRLTI